MNTHSSNIRVALTDLWAIDNFVGCSTEWREQMLLLLHSKNIVTHSLRVCLLRYFISIM